MRLPWPVLGRYAMPQGPSFPPDHPGAVAASETAERHGALGLGHCALLHRTGGGGGHRHGGRPGAGPEMIAPKHFGPLKGGGGTGVKAAAGLPCGHRFGVVPHQSSGFAGRHNPGRRLFTAGRPSLWVPWASDSALSSAQPPCQPPGLTCQNGDPNSQHPLVGRT